MCENKNYIFHINYEKHVDNMLVLANLITTVAETI